MCFSGLMCINIYHTDSINFPLCCSVFEANVGCSSTFLPFYLFIHVTPFIDGAKFSFANDVSQLYRLEDKRGVNIK